MDRLTELNPRLVVLSITGFGHDGPEGGRAGYDQIAQGEGGLMSLTGSSPDDPQRVGVPIADLLAGMYGVYGVLAALLERERTGRGQVVRTCLLAAVVGVHAFQGTRWTVAHEVGRRAGQPPPLDLPRTACSTARTAPCRSRSAATACGGGCAPASAWTRTAPGMATNPERVANRDRVIEVIEAAFAALPGGGAAAPAGRARRPGGPGARPRRGLRLGADPLAGPGDRGRAPHARPDAAARARRCASSPGPDAAEVTAARQPPRRGWVSTTTRCSPGWKRMDAAALEAAETPG